MKNFQKAITLLIAVVLCALCAFPACAEAPEYKGCEEMGGATVGLLTGMPFESMITEKKPDIGGFAFPKGDPQRDVWGAIIDRMKA